MKVIVDAYNILHAMYEKQVSDAQRKHFINILSAYAKRKRLEVIVVFDAGPFLFPATEIQKNIVVKYSGPHASADDIIIRYMHECRGQGMVLVSSDRALRDAAKQVHAESLSAQEFIVRLNEREQPVRATTEKAVKMQSTAHDIVDALMHQAKVTVKSIDKDEDVVQDRRGSAHKESKQDRVRSHKLKKL